MTISLLLRILNGAIANSSTPDELFEISVFHNLYSSVVTRASVELIVAGPSVCDRMRVTIVGHI